jgi:hypothetical protein
MKWWQDNGDAPLQQVRVAKLNSSSFNAVEFQRERGAAITTAAPGTVLE